MQEIDRNFLHSVTDCLGLAIAAATAERHGGRVEVASRLGVGTTFAVTLPAA